MLRSFRICFIDYFIFLSTIAVFISSGFGSKLKKITAGTAWNVSKYRFSVTRIFSYRIKSYVKIRVRENSYACIFYAVSFSKTRCCAKLFQCFGIHIFAAYKVLTIVMSDVFPGSGQSISRKVWDQKDT